ncbi:putative gustatory receptor 28a [Athalia rosae]|uniref:putative gustatory receptor 28a n=1 Tax=Athalia rosae TaxID=37344 RepID=UPI00203352B2|nr:putative gustatory receptor 28a [Athalia rosae]
MLKTSNAHLTFLYRATKIFGLAPFALKNNMAVEGSAPDVLYPFFAAIFYLLSGIALSYVRLSANFSVNDRLSITTDVLTEQIGTVAVVAVILTNRSKRDVIVDVFNSFVEIDRILATLNIRQDYPGLFRTRARRFGYFYCLISMAENQLSIASWIFNDAITARHFLIILVSGNGMYFVFHLVLFLFANIMELITERCEQLNDALSALCSVERSRTPNSTRLNVADVGAVGFGRSEALERLKRIQELHHRVTELIDKTVDLFSLPVLATVGFYFANLVTLSFGIYMFTEVVWMAGTAVLWMIPLVLELYAVAVVSASVQNSVRRSPKILNGVWIKHRPHDLQNEIQMLSLQMLQTPVVVSAFGFFPLDYSILYTMFCTVVGYILIMIQFDNSRRDPAAKIKIRQSAWHRILPNYRAD